MSLWWILKLIPKNLLSRLVGWLVRLSLPEPVRIWALKWFASRYRIRLDEAREPIEAYPNIQALFTRRLKPGIRPIESDWIHPVDGVLTSIQRVSSDSVLQAKGVSYLVSELIFGRSAEGSELSGRSKTFDGAWALTYYLCPADYHRIHSPANARLGCSRLIPGTLWPVNPWSVQNVPGLFAINERVTLDMETDLGPLTVVMVGATNVGQISLSVDSEIVTNLPHGPSQPMDKHYSPEKVISVGEELGVFNMGSTVIVIAPAALDLSQLVAGPVKMGGSLLRTNKL